MANCRSIHRWSFVSLVGSYLDLGLAYFFLCAAALVFITSKFLSFFGLSLPCPCNGLFGHQDRTICVQSSLVDQPTARIEGVHRRVRTLSPFEGRAEELVRVGDGNQLRRSDSVFSESVRSVQACESEIGDKLESTLFLELERERNELVIQSESGSQSDEISDTDSDGPEQTTETDPNSAIQTLKSALEKERSARIALTLELEKERNASSSAADEAMAMILRLQKEKSEIEIEARQFKRITEEKSVYDLEEMEVLKEIVVKRELEIFQLERELEMCQTLIFGLSENKSLEKSLEINDSNLNLEVKHDGKLDEMNDLNLSEESKEVTVYDVHVVSDEMSIITDIPLIEESKSKGKMSRGKEVEIEKSTRSGKKSVKEDQRDLRLRPSVSIEKFKLENEVEILRKRLKLIRKEREKLGFGVEEREKEKELYELKLLEEISRQLKEIKKCAETSKTGQSSLQMVKHTR
ncbi:hypothetical protein LUZ60_004708 [Juncus effusus]|nr:hypothetical protein LUZ60_004708 [Juncus effusus]